MVTNSRPQDYDSYTVRISFAAGFELRRVGPHAFLIAPGGTNQLTSLWVSVSFAPANGYGIERFLPASMDKKTGVGAWLPARWKTANGLATSSHDLPDFAAAAASSAARWGAYWSGGGMVDLSAGFAVDARAAELERRTVLSLYLQGAQEAGFVFTSESGLIQNSWVGDLIYDKRACRSSELHASQRVARHWAAMCFAMVCSVLCYESVGKRRFAPSLRPAPRTRTRGGLHTRVRIPGRPTCTAGPARVAAP